jgi:hypothetical protein
MKVRPAVCSEELEEFHQMTGTKSEFRSLFSPCLAWSYCWTIRKYLGLKSAVFVVTASVLWGFADARNLRWFGWRIRWCKCVCGLLSATCFKGSAHVFCDVPPCILVDIYQLLGGTCCLRCPGTRKWRQVPPKCCIPDNTMSLPKIRILYSQSWEIDLKFCNYVNLRDTLLYSEGFGPTQSVFICSRTSCILRRICLC